MGTYQFANNAFTTLGSAISPTATAITVASGTGAKFPTPGAGQYFMATLFASGSSTGLPNEIVRVTARTGDTLTVVRGQEGTTAQSWSVGDTFANFITAGFLNQLVDSGSLQLQTGNFAADTGTANAGSITLVPVPSSLGGVPIRIKKMGATSTGAYTLTIVGVGVAPVLLGGANLEGGELVGNEIFEVAYDGTYFNLLSPPAVLHGDRIAASSVQNLALALMSAYTLKGNLTGGTTSPYDIPLASLISALGIGAITQNGDGWYFNIGSTLIQFGVKGGTAAVFNFPTPFPNAVMCLIVSNANSMGRYGDVAFGYPTSNAQYYMATKAVDNGNITGFPAFWLAIGN